MLTASTSTGHSGSKCRLSGSILLLLAAIPQAVQGLQWSAPTECSDFTIGWSGGKGPFTLLLAPINVPARNVSIPSSALSNGQGKYTFQLALGRQTEFIMTLSDSTGFNALGTSDDLVVSSPSGSSQTPSCNVNDPSSAFAISYDSTFLQECKDFEFTGFNNANQPITIYGLIAAGQSFTLNPPTASNGSYSWLANVAAGTQVLFTAFDATGKFANSSGIVPAGSGSTDSCLSSGSHSSTTMGSSSQTATSTSSSASNTSGSGSGSNDNSSSPTGAIVGGVVGGLVALAALAILLLLCVRSRRRNRYGSGAATGFAPTSRKGNSIDLLPRAGAASAGAARPLNGSGDTGSSDSDEHHRHRRNDYDPTPYVLPPIVPSNRQEDASPRSEVTGSSMHDPYASPGPSGGRPSTASGGGYFHSERSKAAMATMDRTDSAVAPNAPARFLVHEDGGSVEERQRVEQDDGRREVDEEDGEWSEEELEDLPPTYNSLGVLVQPERRPSRRRSTRRGQQAGGNTSATPAVPRLPGTREDS